VSCTVEKTLTEHEHLFLEGEKQTHVYLVVEGVVGMYKLLADGRRQISTFAYPGDIIGLDSIGTHVNSGEALSKALVRCIPVNAIEKLIRSEPGFGQALLFLTASELAETREQMLSLGRKSAAEKVATFLLRISRRSMAIGQSGDVLSIPMKRSEIADFLGLTIETVSRTFTKLKVARVIRLMANSQVEVIDMDKLVSIAEGQAAAVMH
jgi:CRP/FNR family transcriptional regulator